MNEIQETWTWRELPILRAALHRVDHQEDLALEAIRAETGLTGPQLRQGLHALENATPPYLDVAIAGGWRDDYAGGLLLSVSERTRRELGSWPSAEALVDRLAEVLRDAAGAEPEPARKSKLQAAAEALGSFARDVAVQAIGARLGTL